MPEYTAIISRPRQQEIAPTEYSPRERIRFEAADLVETSRIAESKLAEQLEETNATVLAVWLSAPKLELTPHQVIEALDTTNLPGYAEELAGLPVIELDEMHDDDDLGDEYLEMVEAACNVVSNLTRHVIDCEVEQDIDGQWVTIERRLLHTDTSLTRAHDEFETYAIDEEPANRLDQLLAIVTGILDAANEVR